MNHVAAYLLVVVGGNATPSAEDVTKVLEAGGVEANADSIASLIAEFEGKDVNEIVAAGLAKVNNAAANATSKFLFTF